MTATVSTQPTYQVVNPATGEVGEKFDFATHAEVEQILAASAEAYRSWRDVPIAERAQIVARVAELFKKHSARLGAIATEEMGKPLPEAVGEAEYVRRTGLHSHLTIPLRIGGSIVGAIAFSAFRETRTWPDDLIDRLKLVGSVFAHAIARKREQEKLLEAMAEIKVLKERLERENAYLKDIAQIRPLQGLVGRSPRFFPNRVAACFMPVSQSIQWDLHPTGPRLEKIGTGSESSRCLSRFFPNG